MQLAANATSVSQSQLLAAHVVSGPGTVATNPLLGIEYYDSGYHGATLTLYGTSGSGCYSGTTYGFRSLPSGWNDEISSAKGYSNCWGDHYQNTGYSGVELVCKPNCSGFSAMNDRTSSIIFF